jgi:peptide/nickel transport system permease protein
LGPLTESPPEEHLAERRRPLAKNPVLFGPGWEALAYGVRRGLAALLLVLGITAVSFTLTQIVPGDPAAANLTPQALEDPKVVASFRQRYGLDKPVPVQYLLYLERFVHGDLGVSERTHRPVLADLAEFAPSTAELAVSAMAIAIPVGIALGALAAVRRQSMLDQVIRLLSVSALSVPSFWLGLIALYIFFYKLRIVPISGRLSPGLAPPTHVTGLFTVDALLSGDLGAFTDAIQHIALPAIVLATYNIGYMARFSRSAILEVSGQDFVRTALAKGLSPFRILVRHVLWAALPPIVTIAGLSAANVLTGTVLVESIFSWPGIGEYAYISATNLDLPAIMGVSIFVAIVYIAVNLTVDLLNAIIDPRVRLA